MRSPVIITVLVAPLVAALAAPARADTLPPTVALPVPTLTDVVFENYGQTQGKVDDGSDGKDVIVAGKHWSTRLDASKLPGDERAKKGIVADRMTTRGYADTEPVVPNDSPANQARNRRVELARLDCKPK